MNKKDLRTHRDDKRKRQPEARKKHPSGNRRVTALPKQAITPDSGVAEFTEGESVDLLIGDRTEIGYKAVINGTREGLLYKNEVFQPLRRGQHISGFIKHVREDGKIDLCLQKPGAEKVDETAGLIIDMLRAIGGYIAVDDKTPPDEIYRMFRTSKKTFKKAIGALYKRRLILIEDTGIRLVKKDGMKS